MTVKQSHWHVHVRPRSNALDGHGRAVHAEVRQLGFDHIESVRSSRVYMLAGRLDERAVEMLARELLADPVAEEFTAGPGLGTRSDRGPSIEVQTLPGVMNPVALSALAAARRLLERRQRGDGVLDDIQTARRYQIVGARRAEELERIARGILSNSCIEAAYVIGCGRTDPIPDTLPVSPHRPFRLTSVRLDGLSDEELARLSRDTHLFLSVEELCAIRDHFAGRRREPTDLELETLAQTWSEHCVHKTLRSAVHYTGDDFGRPGRVDVRFENLLKETIVRATDTLSRDWCLSVFTDNAGIVAFDDEYGVAFKAETHNHPSAIEPYGGAATGVGGCIRDIMGCGLGAKPIASTDVFCLASPDFDDDRLPRDVLHPRRVLRGVVRGVRDYGNRMGIPTVNGAIYFDDRYLANPLVFCGCVGLIPRDKIHKQPLQGDVIVVAGGRTGRDGIHGATFSSAEFTDQRADEFAHAVQIGNAVEEKKLLDAQLIARDHSSGCLYSSVTDCGAGGLSSAVGEMAESLGAEVDLDRVPLKYAGLRYDEIWISEAQERMVFAVPPDKLDRFREIFAAEEVEAVAIGTFTGDGFLRVRYQGQITGELDMRFLHHGRPGQSLRATWTSTHGDAGRSSQDTPSTDGPPESPDESAITVPDADTEKRHPPNHLRGCLLEELGRLNTASKEWVIRQYDHEVQGRSVLKPQAGPGDGPSDAAVLRPRYDRRAGIAIGCGLCPERTADDPYWMAICAVDEALRNVVCVGADPDRTAILDNFCWAKVDNERSLGELVRACRGASDVAIAYGLPFVSGKDSLNNEFAMDPSEARRTGLPERLAIPGTLLISALGRVDNVAQCVSMDFKHAGNRIVVASAPVRNVGLEEAKRLHDRVSRMIRTGRVRSAHDVSDGGIACALAEMCIGGVLGADIRLGDTMFQHALFDAIPTTYVLECEADGLEEIPAHGWHIVGTVLSEPALRLDAGDAGRIDIPVNELDHAWRHPLAGGGGGC